MHVGDCAGKAGSACSGVEDEDTFRQWLSNYGGYVHPSLRLAESPSCQGRSVNENILVLQFWPILSF